MSGTDVVATVTGAVAYLRISVGDAAEGWIPCDGLLDDGERLAELVAGTAAGRGTDRQDVAMSLFVQGYAFRVASAAIGAWLLADAVLDVSPGNTAIAIGRHRPNALRLHDGRPRPSAQPLVDLQGALVDGHLARLVAAAHRACRIGVPLLWGNVAAAIASSFGAFDDAVPTGHPTVRRRFGDFLVAARPEVAHAGRLVPVGERWAWERGSCCLWYRTDGGSRCEDCSLWSDDERRHRYAAAIARQGGRS